MIKRHYSVFIPELLLLAIPLALLFSHDANALDPALNPRSMVLALALLFIWPFFVLRSSFKRALQSWPALLFLVYLLAEISAWLLNGSQAEGGFIILKEFAFYSVFLMISSVDWQGGQRNFLALFSQITLLALIAYSFVVTIFPHWSELGNSFPFSDLKSTMAHHNLLASAVLLLLPFTLCSSKRVWRFSGGLLVILGLALIYLTKSRSALLGAGLGIMVFSLTFVLKKPLSLIRPGKSLPLFLALVFFIPLYLIQERYIFKGTGQGKTLQSQLVETSGSAKRFSAGERLEMWDYSLAMIQDQGLLGVGSGNWRIEFPAYGSELYRARQGIVQFQRPHNDFLWIWAETGLIGLVSYLVFIAFLYFKTFSRLSEPNSNWLLLMLAGLSGALVVAFFSFPRERIFHQFLFFSMAGILNASGPVASPWKLNRWGNSLLIVSGIGLLALFAFSAQQRWQGERLSRKMIMAQANSDWSALLSLKAQSDKLWGYHLSPVAMPMEFYSGLAYLNKGNLDQALREYKRAFNRHPNNLQVTNNLANTYNLLGKTDSAIVYYRQAISISPHYKEGILNLASSYFNQGQALKAYALLREKAAEFDEDRELYEKYVEAVLNTLAVKQGQSLQSFSSEELIRLHYILAYDIPQADALAFILSKSPNN